MRDLDVTALLRDLQSAIVRGEDDLARRRVEPLDELVAREPLASVRWTSSRETLTQLLARADDPAAPLVAAHVAELIVFRVNRQAELALAAARRAPRVLVHATGRRCSFDEALDALVARAPDRALVASALPAGAEAAGHAARLARRREGEIERLLGSGAPEPAARRLPQDRPAHAGCAPPSPTPEPVVHRSPLVRAVAARLGRSLVLELGPRVVSTTTLEDTVARGAGHGFDVGFPREMSMQRWMSLLPSPFRDGEPIGALAMPRALAPASFLLGFSRLGCAWSLAARSRTLPLALSRTPHGLEDRTTGALFARWFGEGAFQSRVLGLTRAEQSRAGRQAATILAHRLLRCALAAALLPDLLDDRPREVRSTWEELARPVFGVALAPGLVGLVPRVESSAPTALAAFGLAALLALELRERFDEDCFRNPRTVEELRHRRSSSPALVADPGEVERGLGLLVRWLSERLA